MLNTLKTVMAGTAFVVLMSQPIAAQPLSSPAQQRAFCERQGMGFEGGRCVPNAQQNAPAPNNGGQRGGQAGGRGNGQQNNAQPGNSNDNTANNPRQGGGQAAGRGNDQQNNGRFGNNNNNNNNNSNNANNRGQGGGQFGGRGNDQQNNGRFGNNNNNNDNSGRNDNARNNAGNNFRRFDGRRDNNRFDFERRAFGRDFERRDFTMRFYGRYGADPFNFDRDRELFRARQNWREQYPHDYVFADDPFYSECRSDRAVGDSLLGMIFGGFLGNAVSGGRADATVAGMVFGGFAAANLARDLDCEDRYYVYRAYFDGFERRRPRTEYPWRNPRTGRYGTLFVGDYYRDRDGYLCATYEQEIFVRGRPVTAQGYACRQFDGTWAIVS